MPRDYRLVLYLGEWRVCSKARRIIDGEIAIQWIFGEQRIVLCDVGQEQDIMELPKEGGRNFFGDHFHHALDIQRPHGHKPTKVGGVNDPGAAQAAFEHLVRVTEPTAQITLREGGRVIAQSIGQAVWSELIQRWVSPELRPFKTVPVIATGEQHDQGAAEHRQLPGPSAGV